MAEQVARGAPRGRGMRARGGPRGGMSNGAQAYGGTPYDASGFYQGSYAQGYDNGYGYYGEQAADPYAGGYDQGYGGGYGYAAPQRGYGARGGGGPMRSRGGRGGRPYANGRGGVGGGKPYTKPEEKPVVPGHQLFVYNLSVEADDSTLWSMFAPYGKVVKVDIIRDRTKDNQCKGFGFVTMPDYDEATAAVAALNGSTYEGNPTRPLQVSFKKDKSM